ncbi:T9SS type A sorting domain-containing protein [Candidatus Poribacteria bacterium]|nr:T9SS type A sorting domain-containing protein [Candidatus Poribacteria bacterium]
MKTLTFRIKECLQIYITLFGIVCLPQVAVAIERIATIGHQRPIQHAFLDSNTFFRVVPNHIQVVDANTGDVKDGFGNLSEDSDVVFSQNATHLAILNYSNKTKKTDVEIWNTITQEKISDWETEADIDANTVFSPITPILISYDNKEIYLWNWETGVSLGKMVGARRPLEYCYVSENHRSCSRSTHSKSVFTADGKFLIVASQRPDIEVWNVETRELVGHFEGHTGDWVEGVAISPDGTRLASFEISDDVYVWDIETRELLWKEKSAIRKILNVTFSPDSQRLYVASETYGLGRSGGTAWEGWDDKVRVWDVQTRQQLQTVETEFRSLEEIALSPDGKTLLMHFLDGVVLWNIEENRQKNVWTDFVGGWYSNSTMLSPDGKTVVSGSDHFIKIWDVDSQQLRQLISAEDYMFGGLAFLPDSQTFAVSKSPWIELRNIKTGEVETRFSQYVPGLEGFNCSPSGRWIGIANYRGEVVIYDRENPENRQEVHKRPENESPYIDFIGFSDNAEYFIATGYKRHGQDSTPLIKVWKRVCNRFIYQYTETGKAFWGNSAFTTTADGSTVFAAEGNEIEVWKILPRKLELLTTLDGEGPLQFSPDSRYLFANAEEHFEIWDWMASRRIKHSTSIPRYVSLSQDGSMLMSRDYSNTDQYMIWDTTGSISHLPYVVEPKDRKIVTLGEIKRNRLLQNFPNPFNPETWIPFQLADNSNVTIQIYTPTGNLVRTLSLGVMAAGTYTSQSKAIHWDGRNNRGEPVSSGIYLYTINAGEFSATRKMLIMK